MGEDRSTWQAVAFFAFKFLPYADGRVRRRLAFSGQTATGRPHGATMSIVTDFFVNRPYTRSPDMRIAEDLISGVSRAPRKSIFSRVHD